MLRRSIYRWLVGIVAVAITVVIMRLLPGGWQLKWDSIWGVVVFVPVLAVVNAVIGTMLRVLSIPITCLTLGLFGFVINAIVFWIAGSATGAKNGLGEPMSFVPAFIGSILYTVISTPLSSMIQERQ